MLMNYVKHCDGDSPEALTIARCAVPDCADHQILIKVAAFGVNRADTLQRQGHYPPPPGDSAVLGLEVAGTVAAAGKNVGHWKVGEQVFALVGGGGYAEYALVDANHVMRVPKGVTVEEAAGIAEVFLTAYQSLFWLGGLQGEETLHVHAGASGVGLAAIQLAHEAGAFVSCSASSADKLAVCGRFGADLGINYKEQDVADALKAQKRTVNVVLDMIGGDNLNRNLKMLARDGRIVNLAMLGGRRAEIDMALLLGKRATIIGSTLRNRDDDYKKRLIGAFSAEYLPKFSSGRLKVNVDTILPAADIAQAHDRLENNLTSGKIICRW